MNNPTQHRTWIFGLYRRVTGTTLALAIMLCAIPALAAPFAFVTNANSNNV